MADTKTYTVNYNLEKPGQDDFYNVDVFNANADKIDAELKAAADRDTAHKNVPLLDHPDNSVTDVKIGNRTITDTITAAAGANTITNLFNMIGNMLKRVTGKSNWWIAPATTLEAANTHITSTSGAHGATNANTANTIVQRDASGNFIANTITAALNGLAATATKLATARTINNVAFDGSANITIADSTKAPIAHSSTDTTYGVSTASAYGHAMASSATPLVNGTAAVGTDNGKFAREGHVHPIDTTRAPLASPGLTGAPTAPTAAVGTNTTQIATTAFVQAAVSSSVITSTKNTNTYVRYYPDGTIKQIGYVSGVNLASGAYTVTFPVQFPTKVRKVFMQIGKISIDNGVAAISIQADPTTTSFTFTHRDPDSYLQSYWWEAEGE